MRLEDHKFSQQHKELLGQYLSGIQVVLFILMLCFVFSLLISREKDLELVMIHSFCPWMEFGNVCNELLTCITALAID